MKLWMNVADAAEYAGLSGDKIFKKSWVLTVLKAHEVASPPHREPPKWGLRRPITIEGGAVS